MERPQFIDEHELAEMTGRSVKTVRKDRLVGSGVPFYKIGRSVRYNLAEVIEYLNRCKRASTSDTGEAHHAGA